MVVLENVIAPVYLVSKLYDLDQHVEPKEQTSNDQPVRKVKCQPSNEAQQTGRDAHWPLEKGDDDDQDEELDEQGNDDSEVYVEEWQEALWATVYAHMSF